MNIKKVISRIFVLLFVIISCSFSTDAAVKSHVNTGNPAFPFPQFMDYSPQCKSLATHNAPGVTHAEMEKRILDAWQHICNNTKEHGYEVDGVQYLIPDATNAETHCECAEGDGYYLLPSAIMGDKAYFDGYYMSMHDRMFIGVERFYDGGTNAYDGYTKGLNGSGGFGAGAGMALGSYSPGSASATDGDVDIALALLIAAKQWGEHSGIQTRFGELNYKEEALKYIRAMVDPVEYNGLGCYVSGDVGFDGYLKGGSHQANLTNWMTRGSGKTYKGYVPENGGTQMLYFDYLAPAYFNEYAKFLQEDENSTDWQINQCLRCEASSDYLMRKLYEVGDNTIPVCGQVSSISDTEFKFSSAQFSEDFRAGWRTILNYVWHGNPTTTWNPVTHEVEDGSNTYEKDMAMRYAKFLANPQSSPWNNACNAIGDMGLKFWGPYTLRDKMDMYGQIGDGFPLNWIHGAGSPAAIASQDFELMGQMFRHCIIAWDDENFTSYETSSPHYFHEWFKLLGMLVLSGNFQAPSKMIPQANCKVYHKVNKTYAFAGDEVEFTISIRNYGSVDAVNTIVKFGLPDGFDFVSSDKGELSGDSVVWNRKTFSGFKTATGLDPTIDSMKVICRLNNNIEQGRYCTSASIRCDNGTGWISDEYPNNITDVMERNCVDVVARALKIEKSVNRDKINPDNIAQFKIDFENSAEAGWINGGRPGVRLSYGHLPIANPAATDQIVSFYRLFHDADEAYINYGNYRVSYYMYDPSLVCFTGSSDCSVGWTMACDYYQGGLKEALKISHETTVEGSDEHGKWNQRIIVQFADQLATVSQHLQQYASAGVADGLHVHEGGGSTLLLNMRMACSQGGKTFDLTDDWSYSGEWASAEQNDLHYPIVNDFSDPDNLDQPITSWDRHSCGTPDKTCDRILVEEWDGYTWRRILGNGPMPGRDVYNVVVRDTLPKGLKFEEFVGACPLEEFGGSWKTESTSDGRDVIVWTIDRMMIKQKGSIVYNATVNFPSGKSCMTDDELIENKAWIWGDKESAVYDTAKIIVTCAKVPDPIIPTTLEKSADKEFYEIGDDITYTIEYEQTHGAIFENAEDKSSDWNASGFSFSGGSLSTVQNQLGTAQYNYSKGSNYYMKMDIDPATYATFQIVFRQGASSPVTLQIKPDLSQNVLMITTYNGSSVKQATQDVVFKGSTSPISMIVDLTEDLLRLWVNKDTTSGPVYSVSGLSKGVGYVALKNGDRTGGDSYGLHKFSNIYIHTDYAYNLSIVDRKPTEVSFTSATEGGKLVGDSIVWSFEQGIDNPIPFGTKYKVTWDGKVDDCSESIINIAYAKLLGHADNEIMTQAVSGCGASCALTSITLQEDANDVCGDSVILRANAKSSGIYNYEYFLNGSKVGSTTKTDTFVAKISGNYTVKVTDPSDATCTLTSDPTTIVIKERPTGDDYTIGLFCEGVSSADNSIYQNAITALAQKESDGCTISWYNAAGQTLSTMPNPDDEAAGTYDYEYVIEKNGCYSDTLHMTYAVSDTAVLDLKDVSICSGQSATLSVPSDASYTYKWSDNTTTTNELSTSVAGTYSVIVTNGDGCESHASAKVTVADKLEVDLGKDTTVCEKTLPYVLDATANYDSFDWGDGVSTQTYNVTSSGTYKVTVTQGTCSGEGSVTVTVSSIEDPTGTFSVSYKVSDTTSAGVFDKTLTQQDVSVLDVKSGVSYTWYDKNKNKISGEPIPSVPADGSNATETYYVSAKNADGCESDLKEITVTISGAPTPMVENVEYCLNEEDVMALTATPTNGNNVSETWTLQWYDSNGNKISAPTPDVTTLGVQTYYVSQVSDLTGAESGKVPVKVTIYGTAEPSVADNRTSYCSGDTYDPLTVTSNSDATKYLMPGDMVWTVDGTEVGATPTIPQSASVTFTVREDYKISEGHVCKGSPVALVVTTTTIEKPSGDFTVTYLKKEGESGTFPSLIEKNSNVARTNVPGYILVWYDSNKTKLGENAPSPAYNSSWTEGDDQTLTYYVAQSNGTCESELVEVTVTISDSPMPRTSAVTYCQDDVAQPLTAEINETADVASNYTLVWYDPNTKEELPNAPTPETNVPGEYTYMVAQRHNVTLATSSPSPLKVTIYRLPELTTTEPVAQCGGSVTLSDYIKESQGQAVTQSYYEDAAKTVTSAAVVTKSGTYYSDAYYTINSGVQCKSATVSVNVTINDLSDLTITGSQTSCPNGTVELTANAKSNDPGIVTYKWESENENTDGKYITPTLTGNYGKKYTFTVKASAGACVETVKATHEVTIDKGVLTGEMTMNGVSQKVYKTCGDENITIATTHEGTDYQWSTLDGTAVSGTTSIEVTPTQTTTYVLNLTNVCATSDTVIVEVHPLAVTADWSKLNTTICEGTPFSASLNITGYDASMTGSYIKWYKNDEEQTQYANKETLSVESGKASDSGVYRYEVSNGICVIPESGTTDSGELTVVEKATYTKTENVVSCSAEEVEIAVKTDDSDVVVTWADDATAGATRMVSPTENTTYKFTVTRQTVCVTEDELDVQVKAKPEVTIEDVNLCAGDKTILKAEATGDELIGYVWTNGAGEEFTTKNLTVNPDSTEYYTITVKSKSCGDTSATVKVTVVELPELEVDSIALRSREIRVLSGGSSTNFEYRIDKGDWQTNGLFENIAYALHTAYAKDELGCEGSLMFEVVAPPVVLPEFFTPQGDGVNDEWDLAKILDVYPDAVVKVFDRYGKVVAELKGDVDSWDGSYNGKMLPSTDYWYTINIPEIDRMYSGHFTLIRSK